MYKIDDIKMLRLGQRDENLAREIQMDASDWLELYPGASIAILFRRPGESTITPMITTLIGTTLTWQINDFEVGITGVGNAEIRAVDVAGLRRKSRIIPCSIEETLLGDDETVLYTQDQVDETLAHISEAAQAAQAAQASEEAAALSASEAGESAASAGTAADVAVSARDAAQAAQSAAETAQHQAEAAQSGVHADAEAATQAKVAAQAAQASAQGAASQASADRTAAESARADAEAAATHAEAVVEGIDQAGADQVAAVNAAGQAQVTAVNQAGTTQVGNVNAAGTTQVNAVQAKGTQVINSIPADYSALTDEVTDLKSALTDRTLYSASNFNNIPVRKGYIVGATGKNSQSSSGVAINNVGGLPFIYKGSTITVNVGFKGSYAIWAVPMASSTPVTQRLEMALNISAGSSITVEHDGYFFCSAQTPDGSAIASDVSAIDFINSALSVVLYAETVKDKLLTKVDISQGTENAGKVLQVSNDGEVVPGTNLSDYLPAQKTIAEASQMATGKYIASATNGVDWQTKLTTGSGMYLESAVDVSQYIGDTISIVIGGGDAHTGVRQLGFCNSQNIVSASYQEQKLNFVQNGDYLEAIIPVSDTHFFFSISAKTYLRIYVNSSGELAKLSSVDVKYVDTNGDDTNSGIASAPYATVTHAIEAGAKCVCVNGGVYEQQISFANAKHSAIAIVNATPTVQAVFIAPNSLVANTESAVSGYARVYSAEVVKTFSENNIWIFQDGVPDTITEITSTKRMPEQRGQAYRCYDTKIERVSASTLSDALLEIENSEVYKWYLDGSTLYFSRPTTVTNNNPIRGSFNTSLLADCKRGMSLQIVGIDVKYMAFNVPNTSNSRIVDCSAKNVYGEGGFKFDGSIGIEFIRCEAARVYTGSNGDGFNAHSTNTDDPFAHQTTAVLIDCWSHDNNDDGISLHERSEFTVIGGLFEQNMHGGGVTPANGSHCTCYNVYARDNGDGGFLYMNPTSAAEGGVGGQIKCVSCVSESNNINADAIKGGYKVMSAGNKAILISCKAINEPRGYYVADNDGAMLLIDCGAYSCTEIKGGKVANIIAQNTTLVS